MVVGRRDVYIGLVAKGLLSLGGILGGGDSRSIPGKPAVKVVRGADIPPSGHLVGTCKPMGSHVTPITKWVHLLVSIFSLNEATCVDWGNTLGQFVWYVGPALLCEVDLPSTKEFQCLPCIVADHGFLVLVLLSSFNLLLDTSQRFSHKQVTKSKCIYLVPGLSAWGARLGSRLKGWRKGMLC